MSLKNILLLALAGHASASTISTTFATSEGFTTGDTSDVVLSTAGLDVTFSGGLQEQSFDGPAYNNGPDAYFFVNAGPTGSFTGSFGRSIMGNIDIGTVTFSSGLQELSFNAADRANGTPSFRLLDTGGNLILTQTITGTDNRNADTFFSYDSSNLGGNLIGSIEFDNAGPAANPPYVIAIDNFTASTVPEPSTALLGSLALLLGVARRKRA